MAASHTPAAKPTGWVGWIAFTAAMLLILGVFNAINGLAAILSADVFLGGAVMLNVATWGWIHLVVGIGLATTGWFLFKGAPWARAVAIVALMINMFAQALFLPAYPFWSLLIIAVDVLALWALVVHGDEQVA